MSLFGSQKAENFVDKLNKVKRMSQIAIVKQYEEPIIPGQTIIPPVDSKTPTPQKFEQLDQEIGNPASDEQKYKRRLSNEVSKMDFKTVLLEGKKSGINVIKQIN